METFGLYLIEISQELFKNSIRNTKKKTILLKSLSLLIGANASIKHRPLSRPVEDHFIDI